MITATQILQFSGVTCHVFKNIYLTGGNQLIGTYDAMKKFQEATPDYFGWQAHHIVETVDLDRLDITGKFPGRGEQICVLLPERAHIGRINSILRYENPLRLSATSADLLPAYRRAYALMGNYCGGGEAMIREELMAIVTTTFKLAGV